MQAQANPDINYIVFVMVTGALLLASVYHSVLFYYNRVKLIGYYSVYLWSVFAYCFIRCVYVRGIPHIPYFSGDEVLQMVSFALYIRFTKAALELDPIKDRLAYRYSTIAPAIIVGYIALHSFLFWSFFILKLGGVVYTVAYLAIRAFLLFIGFVSLIAAMKKRASPYHRYIFYGILSLIIIGLLATIIEVLWKRNQYVDALTVLAVGYNIDMFFFSGAISYKMRAETIEKENANRKVLEQELEIQRNEMERLVLSFHVKEQERSRIATELHDEIGSTISSISILSEVIIKEKNETSVRSMQAEIKNNAKQIMEKMDDIIWSLNPRNDSMEKMLLRIKQFATPLFEARNINYEYPINPDVYEIPLPIEIRQQAYLIIKEAINNLIKHSGCTKASLSAEVNSSHDLVFTINDNGLGFDTNSESDRNGVLNMKHRAESIGAIIDFVSSGEVGTYVSLSIKIG